MIKHEPIFDTQKVCELFSKKDGVPITYVCTSALDDGAQAMDIFYRETPHPSSVIGILVYTITAIL